MTLKRTVLILFLASVVLVLQCSSQQIDNVPNTINNENHSKNVFDMFLSPLRSSLKQARKLIGDRLTGMSELADGVQKLHEEAFKMFMRIYNKHYSPTELPRRMKLFFERRKQIEESEKEFAEGKSTFKMRENIFADWDAHELKALTGVSPPSSLKEFTPEERAALVSETYRPNENGINVDTEANMTVQRTERRVPMAVDWRKSNCISTPINQQKCGACYAIATMSVIESMRCIKGNMSPILSPQQIVDCATVRAGYQNFGCNGGWPTRVLEYLKDTGVAVKDRCYPFKRQQSSCRLRAIKSRPDCLVNPSPTNTRLTYKVLNNEQDIQYHVANTGPVVTVMKATDKFMYYGDGIFDDRTCSNRRDDVDHGIVIVGYGVENGVDYWLIKNSWGVLEWGVGGYGKYRRGKNACSIGHWGWVVLS